MKIGLIYSYHISSQNIMIIYCGLLRIIFVNKCQQTFCKNLSKIREKIYGKEFLVVKYLIFNPLCFSMLKYLQNSHFFIKALKILKLDIYKCPFSKKFANFIFPKFTHY